MADFLAKRMTFADIIKLSLIDEFFRVMPFAPKFDESINLDNQIYVALYVDQDPMQQLNLTNKLARDIAIFVGGKIGGATEININLSDVEIATSHSSQINI